MPFKDTSSRKPVEASEVIHVFSKWMFVVSSRNRESKDRRDTSSDESRRNVGACLWVMDRHGWVRSFLEEVDRGCSVFCFHKHHVYDLAEIEDC